MAKQEGAASIVIDLSGSAITVSHTNGVLIGLKKNAQKGDWDKLIVFLREDLGIEWQV
jgi:hypothetical protein